MKSILTDIKPDSAVRACARSAVVNAVRVEGAKHSINLAAWVAAGRAREHVPDESVNAVSRHGPIILTRRRWCSRQTKRC